MTAQPEPLTQDAETLLKFRAYFDAFQAVGLPARAHMNRLLDVLMQDGADAANRDTVQQLLAHGVDPDEFFAAAKATRDRILEAAGR